MTQRPFGSEWLAEATACLQRHRFGVEDLILECRSSNTPAGSHHLVFEQGCLVGWHLGSAENPDLVLKLPEYAQLALFTRVGLGEKVLDAVRVVGADPHWPPPLDEIRLAWGRDLPARKGVTFTVSQILTCTPFGDVAIFWRVDHGRVVESGSGVAQASDVTVQRDYTLALRERAGDLDLLESLEGGAVNGSTPKLMLLAGWYESEECIEARRRLTTPACAPLAALGRFLSSSPWTGIGPTLADLELVAPEERNASADDDPADA